MPVAHAAVCVPYVKGMPVKFECAFAQTKNADAVLGEEVLHENPTSHRTGISKTHIQQKDF